MSVNNQNDRETRVYENAGGGRPKWILPLIIILVVLGLILLLTKQCNKEEIIEEPVQVEEPVVVDDPIPAVEGEYDSVNDRYVYDTGAERTITLPNGTTFTVGEASTEAQLYDFLNDENSLVSDNDDEGWMTMNRIYFELNVDHLTDDSKEQLDHVAEILKNYPSTTVRFGGYTDSQAGQDINLPLSQARAEEAMNYVVNKGISSDRLEAKGYGQSKFMCPENDTPECRAKNRRVDIKVIKK